MLLLIAQTNLSEEQKHKNFFSQNILSEAWENFFKITNSQINLSEAWEHLFKNKKAHRAQKDISEALEQFHSS